MTTRQHKREYMREYRKRKSSSTVRLASQSNARRRALEKLADRHPAEFAELYRIEREEAGLAAPEMERPCACGGIIRRRSPAGRFPAECSRCAEVRQVRAEGRSQIVRRYAGMQCSCAEVDCCHDEAGSGHAKTGRAGIVRAGECGTTEPAAPREAAGELSQVSGGGSGI